MLNILVIFTFDENSIVFFNSASFLKVSTFYHNLSFKLDYSSWSKQVDNQTCFDGTLVLSESYDF